MHYFETSLWSSSNPPPHRVREFIYIILLIRAMRRRLVGHRTAPTMPRATKRPGPGSGTTAPTSERVPDQLSFSHNASFVTVLRPIQSGSLSSSPGLSSPSTTIALHPGSRRLGQLMANVNLEAKPRSSLIFSPSSLHDEPLPSFGPRIGLVSVQRQDGTAPVAIRTPGMVTATSRGVVPHLSRDHVRLTKAIRWVHVPFESL